MRNGMIVMAAMLAGCAADGRPDAAPPAPGAQCDAAKVQDLIGRDAAEAEVEREAQARSGAAAVRRYVTGSPVTMDYRGDRLNVETDARGTIVRLTCG